MNEPSPLRSLPPVHAVVGRPALSGLGHPEAVRFARAAIDEARASILDGRAVPTDAEALALRALALVEADRSRLRPVINATGILLNTGLGRAPLAVEAAGEVSTISRGYCNLEVDLETGDRGGRASLVAPQLCRLTGAEAATVVNNNAAATVLVLRALAAGREVVVSRGQLVEIGGSFRLPEIFEASGARLREVGTTNRTRIDDYARAIGPETAAILRVHPSNYRIVGFCESAGIVELSRLARDRGVWMIDDVGSGVLRPGMPPGVGDEPTMSDAIEAGADVVLGSGDKLLGGPQCGIVVGKSAAIARITSDPLMRAFRVDKMTLAALGSTLRLALDKPSKVPLWSLMAMPIARLDERARTIAARLALAGFVAEVEPSEAMLGGGTTPCQALESRAIRLAPPFPGDLAGFDETALARALRTGDPAVVPQVKRSSVVLDVRGVFPHEDDRLVAALTKAASLVPLYVAKGVQDEHS